MSYTANLKAMWKRIKGQPQSNPQELYERLAGLGKTDPAALERIKALKEKGITGWNAVWQAVSDMQTEKSATESQKEQGFNRVEIAFSQLPWEEKRTLFFFAKQIAEEKGGEFILDYEKPLREFTGSERAAIASALKRISTLRDRFGRNLERLEFHPQGAAK